MDTHNHFPYLAMDDTGCRNLYVDGKPFWILGGELHNSSASSAAYMERRVWPSLRGMNMNTVLLTVAWEDIEPREGEFDFSIVQALLDGARRENMRLVLLWFGLWKNTDSAYVPRWVKADTDRFFRAELQNGTPSETISPLCREAVEKDKTAFCRLMTYLAEHDEQHTVIMVQIENEVGLMNSERDFSPAAEAAFLAPVPETVATLYGKEGTWSDLFGERAGEYFMGYHLAAAVEMIASAGKAIWPLPMYVNAWLDQHPFRPGGYPSGGPIPPLCRLWLATATSIDFCAPDIYLPDFVKTCERYLAEGNPLFVPETYCSALSASNALYLFGGLGGIGISPFGIEDMRTWGTPDGETPCWQYMADSYGLLAELQDVILTARAEGRLAAFCKENSNECGTVIPMERWDVQIDYLDASAGKPGSAGILLKEEDGFFLIGCNVRFRALPKMGTRDIVGQGRLEEGEFVNGVWQRERVLNGDELGHTVIGDRPRVLYLGVNLHRYTRV